MPKSAKLGLATLVVGVAIAVTASVALAVLRYDSTVTLDELTTARASGQVSSGHARCVRNRVVRLWMRSTPGGPTTFVGSDRTNTSGVWELNQALAPGNYLARVHRKVIPRRLRRPRRQRIVCRADRSEVRNLSG